MPRTGRPRAIPDDMLDTVRAIAAQKRGATIEEMRQAFTQLTGITVSDPTLQRALVRAGLRRQPRVEPAAAPATPAPKRYGYTQDHRRPADADRYASCLTDAEWALASDLFELPGGGRGRPAKYERRLMVDACCYVLRTGCAWRMLPNSFPPWLAVHKSFSRWAALGKFEELQERLRAQWRLRVQRNVQPTAAIIDSQSNRNSPQGGDSGYDAGKKVKGRKRHVVVDTLGLILAVSVSTASMQDRDGALAVVAQACAKHASIQKLYADGAYAGQCAQRLEHDHSIKVSIVRRPNARGDWDDAQMSLWKHVGGFVLVPRRWVVERTHAWLERSRRLVMHHDRSIKSATAWVWLSQARLLLNRLTRDDTGTELY